MTDSTETVIDFRIYQYIERQNAHIAYISYDYIRIKVFKNNVLMLPVCAFFNSICDDAMMNALTSIHI